jgi:hypothetical protein
MVAEGGSETVMIIHPQVFAVVVFLRQTHPLFFQDLLEKPEMNRFIVNDDSVKIE